MTILGIETATLVCGAALVVDGVVVSEQQVQQKNVHAENIMRLIDTVLRQADRKLGKIDAIAVSIGPGSFTGLRIGLSVAKGLCFSVDKPLVAVPTLLALAQRAIDAGLVKTTFILPVLDARRDEVYCQLFRIEAGNILPVWKERDGTLDALSIDIEGQEVSVTGDAAEKLRISGRFADVTYVPDAFASCSAGTVARIGEQMVLRHNIVDVGTAEPIYVKEFYTKFPNQI